MPVVAQVAVGALLGDQGSGGGRAARYARVLRAFPAADAECAAVRQAHGGIPDTAASAAFLDDLGITAVAVGADAALGAPRHDSESATAHDPVYAVLRDDGGFLTMDQVLRRLPITLEISAFERHVAHLRRDFHIEVQPRRSGDAYKLGVFKAFTGQDDHIRHEAFINPTKIS